MKDKQAKYDRLYMDIARRISEMSYANRAKVGAVTVKDDNIISFGWNGTPKNFNNDCEYYDFVDHIHTKPEVLHAESNAIAKLARSNNTSCGSTLYVSLAPCYACSKLIIQAGIERVVYKEEYPKNGLELLKQAGIEIKKLEDETGRTTKTV